MAIYTPDYEYVEAKKIVDKLGNSKKDKAIKYYIKHHKKWHDKDKKRLEEFSKFFDLLSSFLPKRGGRLN